MLTRRLQPPLVRAGGAEITLARHLATRAAKTLSKMIAEHRGAEPDPALTAQDLIRLHGIGKECESLIRACGRAAEELTAAAKMLTEGEASGASALVDVAMTARATLDLLEAADSTLDLDRATETAEALTVAAASICEDVTAAKMRLAKAQDALAEAVDRALAQDGSKTDLILTSCTPSPRLKHDLAQAKAVLPETIRATAQRLARERQRTKADFRERQRADAKRETEAKVTSIWQGV